MKKILLGNEAIVEAALACGVDFVSGYPGCPAAEIGDIFGKIAKENGVYAEWSTNEKVGLEAAIGASFSGLKSLVNMKSFGINVASDSLMPLVYTGTKAPMVIVVADDPSCWSSAQSEQNSRAYAYLARIPMLEPADPQECYDFTKLAFEISEKFNIPVILRTVTRANHQKMIVEYQPHSAKASRGVGVFVKNPQQFGTMPPRVLEQKQELIEKLEKVKKFADNKLNIITKSKKPNSVGIITSGVTHLHTLETLEIMGLDLSILKMGMFYPLADAKIKSFIKNLKKVLIVEELDGYLEKEVTAIAKDTNPKLEIFGKRGAPWALPEIRELDAEKIGVALAKITGKKFTANKIKPVAVPRRYPKLCPGCPHAFTFAALKRVAPDAIYGGDIGCYMLAGYPPNDVQDFVFDMGASMGISHGISKATNPASAQGFGRARQKVISLIGDATFFHSGISGLINAVYNKSNPLYIILDNRITAMTGHQTNPGVGKTLMNEDTVLLKPEDIAVACGVKNVKVLDPINVKELEETIKDFMNKDEVSVIVCRRICALLEKRIKKAQE